MDDSNILIFPATYSLEPIRGVPDHSALMHLLRRCLFGVGHKELKYFSDKDLNWCLDTILTPSPMPHIPIQEDSDVPDPLVPKGDPWIDAPYENDLIETRRGLFLKMWWVGNILNRDYSLTEKMTLFWHNHFVTEMDIVKDSRYSYRYAAMLRKHALGNYKSLISEGSRNIAMLVYLSGNHNNSDAPNENYARELFELFTLGKGPDVHYTEKDVREAARVLSGFRDHKDTIQVSFEPTLHDSGDKKFSSYFDNRVIKGQTGTSGALETDELIDMIFLRKQAAAFFCRNIYRWLVCDRIDENIEQKIIDPLAQILIDNHFEVIPVLRTLLGSKHFFDPIFRGCIVKSPVDFLLGAMHQFGLNRIFKLDTVHEPWLQFYVSTADINMDIGNPPSVAGWPAYYQAPKFHQWWINSASLGLRIKLLHILSTDKGMVFNGINLRFYFIDFVEQFSQPDDPELLIRDCVGLLFSVPLDSKMISQLKAILLSEQQSAHYWTEAWQKKDDIKDGKTWTDVVNLRLQLFFKKLFSLPEFQMM